MRKAGNPGRPGNGSPGMETLIAESAAHCCRWHQNIKTLRTKHSTVTLQFLYIKNKGDTLHYSYIIWPWIYRPPHLEQENASVEVTCPTDRHFGCRWNVRLSLSGSTSPQIQSHSSLWSDTWSSIHKYTHGRVSQQSLTSCSIYWSPRLAYESLLSTIDSVCLFVKLLLFCFSMESSHFLAVSSPWPPLQNCLLWFLI